jgi:hypothetical protein
MLRTNLATRPFYNARAVHAALALLGALVLAVTLFNVVQLIRLTSAQRTLGASAAANETEAQRLRAEAAAIRGQINPQELRVVSTAASEANAIIDQRAFSWTQLFTLFEATLPADVRITAVRPRLERGGSFVVAMTVEARRASDLDAFMEALEAKAGFRNVLPVQDQTSDAGTVEAIVEGVYEPPAREALPAGGPGQ